MEIVAHRINSRAALSRANSLIDVSENTDQACIERDPTDISRVSRIEFDVIEKQGKIFLAHDLKDINKDTLQLHEALPLLEALDKDLMCDLKSYTPSIIQQVSQAFNEPCWKDRIIFTSHIAQDTRMIARNVPGAQAAWSIPQVDLTGVQVSVPRDHQDLLWWKDNIAERIAPSLAFDACDIISTQFELAVPELIKTAHFYNKKVYVWTLKSPEQAKQMEQLGVDGIIVDY